MSDIKTNETFALKYRPKKLEELAGHKQIISGIRGMLKAKDVPNAFMLVGPSGTGKTTISRMIARYLNCETMDACGKCDSCKAMDDLSSMDYVEVNASESGNIETIRKLIESSSFRPRGRFRVIFLDEVHRLSMQAANALLKPLEEPPEHTLWILATTDPDKIPNSKAVCGRCTQLILNKPTREEIAERLISIAKDAKLKWVKEKYALDIAEASGGHVRDAVQILQAVNTAIRGHDGKPSKKEIKQMVSDLSVKTVDLDTENFNRYLF